MAGHRIEVLDDGTTVTAGQQLTIPRDGHAEFLGQAPHQATVGLEWSGGSLHAAGAWGLWKLSAESVQQPDARVYQSPLPAPPDVLLAVHRRGIVWADDLAPREHFKAPAIYANLRSDGRMTVLARAASTQLVSCWWCPLGPLDAAGRRHRAAPARLRSSRSRSRIGTAREALLYVERTLALHLALAVNGPPLHSNGIHQLSANSVLLQTVGRATPPAYEQTAHRAVATLPSRV